MQSTEKWEAGMNLETDLLSINDIARIFNRSESVVYRWMKDGSLPNKLSKKIGGKRYFIRQRVEEFILETD